MEYLRKMLDYAQERRRMLVILSGILLAVLLLYNGFWGLSTGVIRNWDESLYGISACEMMDSGNYILHTLDYIPDYWNLKPVLAFYGNLAGFLVFGKNIFGLRFFSVVAYLLTAAVIFLFLKKEAGLTAAFGACFGFAVAPPNWVHCFVTGDPDSWLILFVFSSFVCLWHSLRNGWLLSPAAFFLSLAFLTKSFHAGPYCLFTLIWVAVHWKHYRWYHLLAAVPAGLFPAGIWAGFRFHADGWNFFRAMVEVDLLGRVKDGTSDHGASPWYTYLDRLNHHLLSIPILLSSVAVFAGRYIKGGSWLPEKMKGLYCWSLVYFWFVILLYSCCLVKLEWYIWPCMPFLAVPVGLHCRLALDWLRESVRSGSPDRRKVLTAVLVLLAFPVWFGIGEGKAIRFKVKRHRQQDILLWTSGSRDYAGQCFCSVDPAGNFYPPEKSLILVMRFLSCRYILNANIRDFQNSKDSVYLLCTFKDVSAAEALRKAAEDFARRNSLVLVRCEDETALYRKGPVQVKK